MSSLHKKCISSLESRLSEIDDDEHFMSISMLDAGIDCESVFKTILTARRKRTLKRQLMRLGIKGQNLENLLERAITDLQGGIKIEELATRIHEEYLDALEKKKSLKP